MTDRPFFRLLICTCLAWCGPWSDRAFGQARLRRNPVAEEPRKDSPQPPMDQSVARLAEEAKTKIEAKDFPGAVALLQQVIDRSADSYLPTASNAWQFARRSAETLLAENPSLLAEYRKQCDDEANALLADATDDVEALSLIHQRFLLTSAGARSTDRMASLLLDRGATSLAAAYWDRLAECPAHPGFFGPDVRAKHAAALFLSGDSISARRVAAGGPMRVNGRSITQTDLEKSIFVAPTQPASLESWRMLGGDAARLSAGVGDEPILCVEIPSEEILFSKRTELASKIKRINSVFRSRGRPAYVGAVPVADAGIFYVRTAVGVHAIAADTGKSVWPTPYTEGQPLDSQTFRGEDMEFGRSMSPSSFDSLVIGNTAYGALTVDDQRLYLIDELYVQPGSYEFFFGNRDRDADGKRTSNRLTALDRKTGKPVWRIGGPRAANPSTDAGVPPKAESFSEVYFFGPPTPHAGKLYALVECKSEFALWEIDPETGTVRWRLRLMLMNRKIDVDPFRRSQCCHLSIAGGVAVCATNTQMLFGVDLVSRTPLWRRDFESDLTSERRLLNLQFVEVLPPPENPFSVDPPIIIGGKAVATSPNWRSVQCLDLRSGKTLWQTDRAKDYSVLGSAEGLLLMVGADFVRAIDLNDGKQRWTTSIAKPTGRGVVFRRDALTPASDSAFYAMIPTVGGTAQLLRIRDGKLVSSAVGLESEDDQLGNIVLHNHRLMSVDSRKVRLFPLSADARRESEQLLAKNAADPRGLLIAGTLAYVSGDQKASLDHLVRCLLGKPNAMERAQALRIGLSLAEKAAPAKKLAFKKFFELIDLRALSLDDRMLIERHKAEILFAEGKIKEAVASAVSHGAQAPSSGGKALGASRDFQSALAWSQGFIARVFDSAAPDARKPLEDWVLQQYSKQKELPSARVAYVFARTNVGSHLLLQEAKQQASRSLNDQAEVASLLALQNELNPSQLAEAYSLLATTSANAKLEDEVRKHLKSWADAAPNQKDHLGRTPQAFLAQVKITSPVAPPWPNGKVQGSSPKPRRGINSDHMTMSTQWLRPAGMPGPFLTRHAVEFLRSETAVSLSLRNLQSGKNGLNGVATLDSSQNSRFSMGEGESAIAYGRHLFVSWGKKIGLVSLLEQSNRREIFSFESEEDQLESLFEDTPDFSGEPAPKIMELTTAGPGFVVVRFGGGLTAIDGLTSEVLWKRGNIAPEDIVVGDDRAILHIQPHAGAFRIIRAADGEVLKSGKWDWLANRTGDVRFIGRRVLRTSPAGDQFSIHLWDPLTDSSIWKKKFHSGARWFFERSYNTVTILEPSGQTTVLSVDTGQSILQAQLGAMVGRRTSIRTIVEPNHIFLGVTWNGNQFMKSLTMPAQIPLVELDGTLIAYQAKDGARLWDRKLTKASIIDWPFQEIPVMVVVSKTNSGGVGAIFEQVFVADTARKIDLISKSTGQSSASVAAGEDFHLITSASFRVYSSSSRIELNQWQSQITFDFQSTNVKKNTTDASLEDFGDLTGKWMEAIHKNQNKGSKPKK